METIKRWTETGDERQSWGYMTRRWGRKAKRLYHRDFLGEAGGARLPSLRGENEEFLKRAEVGTLRKFHKGGASRGEEPAEKTEKVQLGGCLV